MRQQSPFDRAPALAGTILAALWLACAPAFAHHGWEGYLTEDFEITGTVTSTVSLAGPHATLKIRANDRLWNVVLAPPPRTASAGLKAGMIPVGAQVTAYGHRHKDPKTFEIKTERLRWNDRLFDVYPDRS
ncbi:MAG: DUF6152 family protein [Vicinamibacterales bacterium]